MSQDFEIVPHLGVGPIRFGMDRSDVKLVMGASERINRREFALDEDCFEKLGVVVHYDSEGRCHAVGIARYIPLVLKYDGYPLFQKSARDVLAWARVKDPRLVLEEGFISTNLGLTMSADWLGVDDLEPEEERQPASAFFLFAPGYYEQTLVEAANRQEAQGNARVATLLRERLAKLR
jgi:hypothetical protein